MTPPRLARLLLRFLLPAGERRVVLGDLDEEFSRDVLATRGATAARWWYWRQVLTSLPYAVRLRCLPVLGRIPGDARYALRTWRRNPAFAIAAIGTQAIGIAVATAVLAVAYEVLVRPLPYANQDRLVRISEGISQIGLFSYQDFVDLRHSSRAFEELAGFTGGSRTITGSDAAPERVAAIEVTDRFFELLGVAPYAGRTITAGDVVRGAPPVVILSHAAWTRRFGADADIVGKPLILNGQPHTIVGVLPADFEFPLRGLAELWLPLRPSVRQAAQGYWHWMDVLGRRKVEISEAQAETDLQAVARGFAARDAKWHGDARLFAHPLRDVIVGGVRPTIRALIAGVGLVMLATCATIAGLLLARGASRTRELSVRAAIGAGRSRLAAQLLTENLMLSVAGGLAGIVAGDWLLGAFAAAMPPGRRAALPHFQDPGVGLPIAAATFGLSLATGLIFGLLPAWRAARGDAGAALKSVRSTQARGESRVRFALVGLQVAVALVLLAGAALLGASVHRLLNVSPGFDPDGIVTMRLTLPSTYADLAAINTFHDRVRARVEAIPGVLAVALIDQAPLTGRGNSGALTVVERPIAPGEKAPEVGLRTVSANYFTAMRVPLVRGRTLTEHDTPSTPPVVVVNQWLADRLLAGADPIGQHITFEFAQGRFEIVGIVGNEQFDDVDKPLLPVVYFAARQDGMTSPTLMVRAAQPATAAAAVRGVLSEIDPSIPLFAVRTIEQITSGSAGMFMRRTAMWLLGIFAAAAILLAAIGLYSVLAQAVSERTREIGVRVALGATRGSIFRLVLGRGLAATAAGLALGVVGTVGVSRLLASLLFAVRPADPVIVAAAAALLALIAVLACLIPALRAVRIDPATAVRVE